MASSVEQNAQTMEQENAPKPQEKSKRPNADSNFKQQRLPAWQPVMTARTVIPAFIVIGLIFIPLGAVLFKYANDVMETVIDYTTTCLDCHNTLNTSDIDLTCSCKLNFTLDKVYPSPVYVYYGLENFYQNHRRYVKSRDDRQLLGESITVDNVNQDCLPAKYNDTHLYAPCGAIANSLFNDSFAFSFNKNGAVKIPLIKKGIAWDTDRRVKFQNPIDVSAENLCNSQAFVNTVPPSNWRKRLCELDTETEGNNGYQNEDLIVWMRTAALPNFRKLYRKIDHSVELFKDGLPAGDYSVDIDYNYPVMSFGGKKKIIISTVNWVGGKNSFLGIAYLVVGSLCILLALAFLILHLKVGKKADEIIDVNERTQYN